MTFNFKPFHIPRFPAAPVKPASPANAFKLFTEFDVWAFIPAVNAERASKPEAKGLTVSALFANPSPKPKPIDFKPPRVTRFLRSILRKKMRIFNYLVA